MWERTLIKLWVHRPIEKKEVASEEIILDDFSICDSCRGVFETTSMQQVTYKTGGSESTSYFCGRCRRPYDRSVLRYPRNGVELAHCFYRDNVECDVNGKPI